MMTTLDDVISTVLRAREDGPDALAAVAMSFGAAMELGTLGNTALKARLAETRAALETTEATLRAERDAAREALAAQDSAPDLDYPARAEVWKLREVVEAHRTRAEKAEAERDAAVQEREAFSLRLSAAERERDEARAERDAALARVQALHAELVATRADFGHQRDITEDALRERDEARAALDISRESAREAREEIAGALALVDEARARVEAIAVEHLDGATWIALGADGLPCAWPVPSAEVTP